MQAPSALDNEYQAMARAHIQAALAGLIVGPGMKVLEIGPVEGKPAGHIEGYGSVWHTLDIKPGGTFTADITKRIPVPDASYHVIVCMEVLEHTLDPFAAVANIRAALKPGGLLLASSPLNFRIHGPANDCFRFTEHGIKVLMKDFDELNISILESPDRPLFPIHYSWRARCNKEKSVSHESVAETFRWIG